MSDTFQETSGAGCQLCLIGPPEVDVAVFAPKLEAALAAGGAVAFLLHPAQQQHAADLQQICAGRVAFLLQDDVDLALSLGADGVHLGDPAKVREARARLGPDRILGASCGRSRHAAMLAGEDGADYIAFGEAGRSTSRIARRPPGLSAAAAWRTISALVAASK